MSLSSFAIKRPVSTLMIYAGFCLMGIIALTRLPVELYPDISFGQISIIIYIRGGIPPTEVEAMVTQPIEEAMSIDRPDIIISMGCGDACPFLPGVERREWDINNPAGESIDFMHEVMDEIEARVKSLVDEFRSD